jgi:hypothetical protein
MRSAIRNSLVAIGASAVVLGAAALAYGGTPAVPAGPNAGGHAVRADAAGASTAGTLYTPIAPCRILDTRSSPAGRLQRGVARAVQVSGSTGFSAQGGTATGCGIPTHATSISYSISAVTSAGTGFLRLWPTGIGEPNATALNFGLPAITSGASVQVNPTTGPGLFLISHGAVTNAVIDVTGYSAPQIQSGVTSTGALINSTNRIVSSVLTATGKYTVTVDGPIDGCSTNVTPDGGSIAATAYNVGNQVFIQTVNTSNAATDANFHVSVVC